MSATTSLATAALIWRNRCFFGGLCGKRRTERRKRARGWSNTPCLVPVGVRGAQRRFLCFFEAKISSHSQSKARRHTARQQGTLYTASISIIPMTIIENRFRFSMIVTCRTNRSHPSACAHHAEPFEAPAHRRDEQRGGGEGRRHRPHAPP